MKSFIFVLFAFAPVAHSETYDYTKKIGVGAGYGREFPLMDTGPVEGRTSKSSDWSNFHARYHLNSAGALAFTLSRADLPGTGKMADTYELSYLHRLQPVDRFSWVIGAGVGALDYTKIKSSENWWRFTGKVRAGAEYSICQNLLAAFNVDLGYINNAIAPKNGASGEHEQVNLTPHLNLTWFFGCGDACGKKSEPVQETVPAKKVIPVAKTDGDLDNDGVADSKDKCPGSSAGSEVNAYGCIAAEKAHVEVQVSFASNSFSLSGESYKALEELAGFLKEHPGTKAEIQGHTDSSGNPVKNKNLSAQRAEAVKNYLINNLGIEASRLHSQGMGSEMPVADNATIEGRTKNRRVIAVIEE